MAVTQYGDGTELVILPDGSELITTEDEFAANDIIDFAVDFPSLSGTVCYGHDTAVEEDNTLDFFGNWTGTGSIVGSGDAERFILGPGEYMELDDPVNIGENDVVIKLGDYQAGVGPAITVKYKDGTTAENCEADSWNTYSGPFESTGFVKIRVER